MRSTRWSSGRDQGVSTDSRATIGGRSKSDYTRLPVKRIAETLGVARSNLVERTGGRRPQRSPQTRAGDAELTSDIRRLVDSRPSYGYRRIAALLSVSRNSSKLSSPLH